MSDLLLYGDPAKRRHKVPIAIGLADLLLVTEDGCRTITNYPYDLPA